MVSTPRLVTRGPAPRAGERGVPALAETPPAPDDAGLRAPCAARPTGGRIQVAEQYQFQPLHAARLELVRSGRLGAVCQAASPWLHGYHGVDLIRRFLGLDGEPPDDHARTASCRRSWPAPIAPARRPRNGSSIRSGHRLPRRRRPAGRLRLQRGSSTSRGSAHLGSSSVASAASSTIGRSGPCSITARPRSPSSFVTTPATMATSRATTTRDHARRHVALPEPLRSGPAGRRRDRCRDLPRPDGGVARGRTRRLFARRRRAGPSHRTGHRGGGPDRANGPGPGHVWDEPSVAAG